MVCTEGSSLTSVRPTRAIASNQDMHVESINVGEVRAIRIGDRMITTAIWKRPVRGPVAVDGINVRGDDQADRTVHGGPDKAVYAYALEDAAWWESELRRPFGPGAFGENLSLRGVVFTPYQVVAPNDRVHVAGLSVQHSG